MCSRFMVTSEARRLARATGVPAFPLPKPRYNAAPTQKLPVVRRVAPAAAGREAVEMRWGLLPGWLSEPRTETVLTNARAETVAQKPSFRDSFKRRRCLVPADGFYEWKIAARGRLPWLFQRADGEPLLMAGLWDRWEGEGAEPIESFAILTTSPNELLAAMHDRMPVILSAEAAEQWLAPAAAPADLTALLRPFPAAAMTARPVNPRLNNVANDDPACLDAPPEDGRVPTKQMELGF